MGQKLYWTAGESEIKEGKVWEEEEGNDRRLGGRDDVKENISKKT